MTRTCGAERQLDEYRPDSAVGPVDEDGLSGAYARLAVEHLPGGDAVDDRGLGLRGAQTGRHLDHVGGVEHHVAGPAAGLGQGGHLLAEQVRADAFADGEHAAYQVVSGDEGERRLVVVPAAAHLLLGEGHSGRLHADQDLSRGRGGYRLPVADLQPLRLDLARQDDLDALDGAHHDLHCVLTSRFC